jgi:hypothetical protein
LRRLYYPDIFIIITAQVGEPLKNGSPWAEAAKGTRLQPHPFLRKWAAMFAFGKRSPTPATLTLGGKNTGKAEPANQNRVWVMSVEPMLFLDLDL